jgi:beta-barrel assembly-enhancing protease
MSFTRRRFGCALCGLAWLTLAGETAGQRLSPGEPGRYLVPGYQPPSETDEKGLWSLMDRYERDMKSSRFVVRDADVNAYMREILCRLADRYCKDVRIYIVRTPLFNASMAPNGMMEVWTGLLLRCRDEAQLATIIGHEVGHYLRRHSLERYRDARSKADFGTFLGMGLAIAGVGWAGSLAQLALVATTYSFSRDQEREADEIGLNLMADAGYSPAATAEVWDQLLAEYKGSTAERNQSFLFATHPLPEERLDTLRKAAMARGESGDRGREQYHARLAALRPRLVADELALRQYGRSEIVFEQLLVDAPDDGGLWFAKGEVYRLRGGAGDSERALSAYERALAARGAPPETWRSIGLVELSSGARDRAEKAFGAYLEAKPDATDREVLKTLLAQ